MCVSARFEPWPIKIIMAAETFCCAEHCSTHHHPLSSPSPIFNICNHHHRHLPASIIHPLFCSTTHPRPRSHASKEEEAAVATIVCFCSVRTFAYNTIQHSSSPSPIFNIPNHHHRHLLASIIHPLFRSTTHPRPRPHAFLSCKPRASNGILTRYVIYNII